MANEQTPDAEQLQYLHGLYMQQYNLIVNNINSYANVIASLKSNIEAFEKHAELRNKSALMPLDGGTFVEVKVGNMEKAVVGVGSGYFVEKGLPEAKAFLEENVKKEEELLEKMSEQKAVVEAELVKIEAQLSSLQQEEMK